MIRPLPLTIAARIFEKSAFAVDGPMRNLRLLLPISAASVPILLTLACSAGDLQLPSSPSSPSPPAPPSAGPASSTTQITSVSPDTSFPTQPITISVTVGATSGTPAGTVTVTAGTVSCTASAPTGQCSLALAAAGAATLTAIYSGSATFAASSGTAQHQVILAGTSTTLSSSLNPSARGQSVTFTASVTSTFSTPTGSVAFVEGGCSTPSTTWSTTTVDGTGQASFSTDSLSRGMHTLFACYLGSSTFAPSTSSGLQQSVVRDGEK